MRIGIFGGTFNPPHIGHERSAKSASEQLNLDLLIIIPAGVPPHKPLPEGTPPVDIRLFMSREAFGYLPDTIVSDIETENPKPSYTVATIEQIKRNYPNAVLFLLLGSDMYLTLDDWKDADVLFKNTTPAVFLRNENDREKIKIYSLYLREKHSVQTETVSNMIVPVSSSELREMLPERSGAGYIKDTNYAYIISRRLYNAKPSWEWLRKQSYAMLDPLRVPHVVACEDEAISLAQRWGVNCDDAREAAILHDITKKLSSEEHVKILQDHGVKVGKLQNSEEKLLHSKSGALLAKSMFGVSEAVENAIMWHTTGKAGMSELEKVLYLADYIESTRDFPGVEEMRKLAYESLDKAVIMGLEMTIRDIKSRGITPNKATKDAISDLESSVEGT